MGKKIYNDCEYCYINNIRIIPNIKRGYNSETYINGKMSSEKLIKYEHLH